MTTKYKQCTILFMLKFIESNLQEEYIDWFIFTLNIIEDLAIITNPMLQVKFINNSARSYYNLPKKYSLTNSIKTKELGIFNDLNKRLIIKSLQQLKTLGKNFVKIDLLEKSNHTTITWTIFKLPKNPKHRELIVFLGKTNQPNEFLLNMYHDIKTPINNIIGLTNVMKNITNIPINIKKYINYIKLSTEKLDAFIKETLQNNMNGFFKKKSNTKTSKSKFNISRMLQKTIDLNIISIKNKQLSIEFEHDYNIPKILIADQHKIHRVVINLLDNAIKFTAKGKIKIITKLKSIKDQQAIVEITIADPGMGIPADQYKSIFEKNVTLSKKQQLADLTLNGGLGLWLVKKIVEEIDGNIYVNSSVGKGSKFIFAFPCKIINDLKK